MKLFCSIRKFNWISNGPSNLFLSILTVFKSDSLAFCYMCHSTYFGISEMLYAFFHSMFHVSAFRFFFRFLFMFLSFHFVWFAPPTKRNCVSTWWQVSTFKYIQKHRMPFISHFEISDFVTHIANRSCSPIHPALS